MNTTIYTNKLIHETSPYLLQHAHNPVDWYPWGIEALEKAKNENKVILVSIGYSACHWCHVMERESFENAATALVMNEHFINIKIDREERPDLDHIYMDAVQAITGSGGWPLNVFLTPDAKPFYGGTYFPPVNAFNRSSWTEVLAGVNKAWQERSHEIISQAENLTAHINKAGSFNYDAIKMDGISKNDFFQWEMADEMFEAIMKTADTEWGGFGKAPKFPQTFTIGFLLQYHHYTNNPQALAQALLSIDKMLEGGIYDHVAGGLARYSTDNEWLAPHFEKMLYDNALLIDVLCDAYQITKLEYYKKAIEKTIAFVNNDLKHAEGCFYAALDADSEGVEGKYYVWQKDEINQLLGENAALFCDFFDVSETGNWEHANILRILQPIQAYATAKKLNIIDFEKIMNDCLATLNIERTKRVKPGLDDKIIVGWNALMLKAIAKAAIVLQNNHYTQLAIENYNFIEGNFRVNENNGEMYHTWKNGQAKYPAFLDDYAYYIDACIKLYEATYNTAYLQKAKLLCNYVCDHFSDEEAVFFYFTQASQQDVIVRKKEIYDGAVPSGNAVMAGNLLKLSIIFDEQQWRSRVEKMLLAIAPAASKYPGSFGIWASLLMQHQKGVSEIAVIGMGAEELAAKIQFNLFIPNKILMAAVESLKEFPMFVGKHSGNPLFIYVCKKHTCFPPLTEAEFFKEIWY
jgi:hypothetical protein